jgi:hypothetical protein
MPHITGSGTTVVSIGQSGGVTAGTYINQAVLPELRIMETRGHSNPDGSYTSTIDVQVVAQVTPGNLAVEVQAQGLLDANIMAAPKNGISMTNLRNVMRTSSSYSADVPSPYGQYTISVKTKAEVPINLGSHF